MKSQYSARLAKCFPLAAFLLASLTLFADPAEMGLRVMTFNIWYGGEQVSFNQVVEVIRAANPDIIGIQEPDGNLRKLAEAAGYSYIDEKRNIISRYPLFDPDLGDKKNVYTLVLVQHGRVVGFANTHLTSSPFGPELMRDRKSAAEVQAVEENTRLPEVKPFAQALGNLMARGIPVFFTGDFNSPSHLDWIEQTVRTRPQIRFAFEWPVTKLLADSGMRDSFREMFPDPIKNPGLTWTPGYPHPWRKPNETLDRIDMIWTGGNTKTMESKIVGEPENPDVDLIVSPYPSDHRAVVSSFRVIPAVSPALVAVDTRRIVAGSDVMVRFQLPGNADWGLAIVPKDGDPQRDAVIATKGPNELSTRPSLKLSSLGMKPGSYEAVLLGSNGKEVARTRFWIVGKDAQPELKTEKSIYKSGEDIKALWKNAPGLKNDWIGIYKANDPDIYGGYISFAYTGAEIEGSTLVHPTDPLQPGKYELRLMRDDSYVLLARSAFEVR